MEKFPFQFTLIQAESLFCKKVVMTPFFISHTLWSPSPTVKINLFRGERKKRATFIISFWNECIVEPVLKNSQENLYPGGICAVFESSNPGVAHLLCACIPSTRCFMMSYYELHQIRQKLTIQLAAYTLVSIINLKLIQQEQKYALYIVNMMNNDPDCSKDWFVGHCHLRYT